MKLFEKLTIAALAVTTGVFATATGIAHKTNKDLKAEDININNRIDDLQSQIDDINKQIKALEEKEAADIAEVKADYNSKIELLQNAILAVNQSVDELSLHVEDINETINERIDDVIASLNSAIEALEKADVDNKTELTNKIVELKALVEEYKTALEQADTNLANTLLQKIATEKETLTILIGDKVSALETVMNNKIAEINADYEAKIAALTKQVNDGLAVHTVRFIDKDKNEVIHTEAVQHGYKVDFYEYAGNNYEEGVFYTSGYNFKYTQRTYNFNTQKYNTTVTWSLNNWSFSTDTISEDLDLYTIKEYKEFNYTLPIEYRFVNNTDYSLEYTALSNVENTIDVSYSNETTYKLYTNYRNSSGSYSNKYHSYANEDLVSEWTNNYPVKVSRQLFIEDTEHNITKDTQTIVNLVSQSVANTSGSVSNYTNAKTSYANNAITYATSKVIYVIEVDYRYVTSSPWYTVVDDTIADNRSDTNERLDVSYTPGNISINVKDEYKSTTRLECQLCLYDANPDISYDDTESIVTSIIADGNDMMDKVSLELTIGAYGYLLMRIEESGTLMECKTISITYDTTLFNVKYFYFTFSYLLEV